MKSKFLLLLLSICTTLMVRAQCDSTSDVNQVFAAFKIDDDLPFLQKTTLNLRPELDKASLTIIKNGTSRKKYVRQLTKAGLIVFDSLVLVQKNKENLIAWFRAGPPNGRNQVSQDAE